MGRQMIDEMIFMESAEGVGVYVQSNYYNHKSLLEMKPIRM